ncbi:MAG: two-component hybrid sensor and regulator [Myxococcaceae bacterium]|nr:two-component hybrid sensor and regulator [Myxococcaceae bacterium]
MSKKRVLVVDDHDLNLKLMMYLLATEDCEVVTALNAEQARASMRENKPDLVLLDLQLPDLDGLSLTRLLRADPAFVDLTIVAVTAYAMKGDEERARAAGVDHYVTKPIAKDAFRSMVARLLAHESADTNVGASPAHL